jgi:alcohol dehydrogenase
MEHNGLRPANGPVVVDGATGGVGSIAIAALARLGYHVVALTGKAEEEAYLRSIGAAEIMARQSLDLGKIRPLDKATWAGAIDNLGGDVLAWMLSTMKQWGTVASVGLAADVKLNTTVMPFILRGVQLLGVNSSEGSMPLRQKLWDRLAREWKPSRVQAKVRTIDFDELPSHFDAFLKGTIRGRTVVRIGADPVGN